MSFTGTNIKALIENEVDETLEDNEVIFAVNACLVDLCEWFRKTATQSITVADEDDWTARTDGHLAVVRIADSDGEDYTGEWQLNYDRSQIKIGDTGTFTVESIILPTEISAVATAIGVNDVFKVGIARYAAGVYKLKDDDENADGLRMKAEGASLVIRASSLLIDSDRRPGRRAGISRSAGDWNDLGYRS